MIVLLYCVVFISRSLVSFVYDVMLSQIMSMSTVGGTLYTVATFASRTRMRGTPGAPFEGACAALSSTPCRPHYMVESERRKKGRYVSLYVTLRLRTLCRHVYSQCHQGSVAVSSVYCYAWMIILYAYTQFFANKKT